MSNVSLPDLMNAVMNSVDWFRPIIGIITAMGMGLYILMKISERMRDLDLPSDPVLREAFLAPFEDEKPKRSLDDLASEKPKRLIGDDGELLHPIDEFFYTEDSNDGQA